MAGSMEIKLFGDGNTSYHRVGVAGLYMTLEVLDKDAFADVGSWELHDDRVVLSWGSDQKAFFERLISHSFGLRDDIIDLAYHRAHDLALPERHEIHSIMLGTLLQHLKGKTFAKTSKKVTYMVGTCKVERNFRPLNSYAHRDGMTFLYYEKKGKRTPGGGPNMATQGVPTLSYFYPGGVVRHARGSLCDNTAIMESPERFICLLFAPVGVAFYNIHHKGRDGLYDERRKYAIVIPHVKSLSSYSAAYKDIVGRSVADLYAFGVGDAAFSTLATLNVDRTLETLAVDACTVMIHGTVAWVSNQTPRSDIMEVSVGQNLDRFRRVCASFRSRLLQKKRKEENKKKDKDREEDKGKSKKKEDEGERYIVVNTPFRGLFMDNLAEGNPWYHRFGDLAKSKSAFESLKFYRREFYAMVTGDDIWQNVCERHFVMAVHESLRCHYGHIAEWCKRQGRTPAQIREKIGSEADTIRYGLIRCRTPKEMRRILGRLFSRKNKVSDIQWDEVNGFFGNDHNWEKAIALALCAIGSYPGSARKNGDEDLELLQEPVENQEGEQE